ncbi:hypothetical protein HanRHA438_Chr05g0223041 [Helianthus annuus]|nr:hypothetical protein HanRHA438_Chr05g0223041 [Helianthus annuus]
MTHSQVNAEKNYYATGDVSETEASALKNLSTCIGKLPRPLIPANTIRPCVVVSILAFFLTNHAQTRPPPPPRHV